MVTITARVLTTMLTDSAAQFALKMGTSRMVITVIGTKNSKRCFSRKFEVDSTHSSLIQPRNSEAVNKINPMTEPGMGTPSE